ncbi:MAG TPA: HEAT repeat domain-containing protein, partial [Fimbriimonas sp.]|nr:HEAT repeat domain-containing protein [Fimbriimonas sp.]
MRLAQREAEILRMAAELNPTKLSEFRDGFKPLERLAGKNRRLRRLCCQIVSGFATHEASWVRWEVALTLGNIGTTRDYRTLCLLQKDESVGVRAEAVEAMPVCGWRLGLTRILAVLRADDEEIVKACAARALCQYEPDGELVDAVSTIEQVASEVVRCELACVWFEWFGEDCLGLVMDCFRSDDFECYMMPLWHFGPRRKAWEAISTMRLEVFQRNIDLLVDELVEESCPQWQIDQYSEW